MKIISGEFKGRNIEGYQIIGTRPTMDRVKESIFAMIQNNIKNSLVLDLFAGSGNYGIESLSNHAQFVYFNDKNKEAVKVIKKNLETFHIENKAIVYNFDYKKCLNVLKNECKKFDLIFLDPPYSLHVIEEIIIFILENDLLKPKGIIVSEFQGDNLKDKYLNLKKIKERTYGLKTVYIYKMESI